MLADELVLTHRLFNLVFQTKHNDLQVGLLSDASPERHFSTIKYCVCEAYPKRKKASTYTELSLYKVPWCVHLLIITYTENDTCLKTDKRKKKPLIPVPWNGPPIGLWERFCETSASWSLLMTYLKIRNLVLKLHTQESTLLWVVIGS